MSLIAQMFNRVLGRSLVVKDTAQGKVGHWRFYNGERCVLDLENSLVMIRSTTGDGYTHGSLVYPVGKDGKVPGQHWSNKDWRSVSSISDSYAHQVGVQLGKDAVYFKELFETAGKELGITKQDGVFVYQEMPISEQMAMEAMLDHRALMLLPEGLRNGRPLSKTKSSKLELHESGIILDSLDEVAAAIRIYDSGKVQGSSATNDRFYTDTMKSDNPDVRLDDPSVARQTEKGSFISSLAEATKATDLGERIIKEMLDSKGDYEASFDYGGFGTNFFKTTVRVTPIDGKYLLGIHAAYVGDEPEIELANMIGKGRGLTGLTIKYELQPTEGAWVGVDLDSALNGTPVTEDAARLAKRAAGEQHSDKPCKIELEGIPLTFGMSLIEGYRGDVVRAKGNQIFLQRTGKDQPCFYLSLTPISGRYKKTVVLPEEKAKVVSAATKLKDIVDKNLSL